MLIEYLSFFLANEGLLILKMHVILLINLLKKQEEKGGAVLL